MNLFKQIIRNKDLIIIMGKNDFKNKYLGSSLGSFWGFINPLIQLLTYTFVYQVIFKTHSEVPFVVSFFPVLIVWMFVSETMISTASSIRNYSYLVKKIKFPVDIIPIIPLTSSYIVFLFLNLIVIVINLFFGYYPNIMLLIYMHICTLLFVISFGRLFSALNAIVPDVSHFLSSSMQILFWLTPILWSFSSIEEKYVNILKINPLAYLVDGFRAVYLSDYYWFETAKSTTLLFWGFIVILFLYGNFVFNKAKKEFADNV